MPKLRFSGFEAEYQSLQIGDFASCCAGATPSTNNKSFWENGTIPWLSSGEVNKKRIYSTDTCITQKGYDSCSTKLIPSNTVVMALAGQGKTRGNVAITQIELCTNQSLAAIITNSQVDDEYLLYYLETQYDNLRAISSGDGTRGGLNLQIIREYKINIPFLSEQKKVAAFFTILDKRIDKQRSLIDSLISYKRGLIFSIFSNDNAFAIPMTQTPLFDLLTEYRVKDTKDLRVCSVAVNKGVVDQIEHLGRSFSATDTSNYGRVKFGDIVYTKSPTGDFPYGIVKQNKLNEVVAVSPLYGVYTPKTFEVGNLLHYYFEQHENANNYIRPLAQKGAKNTINITNQTFLQGMILFPYNDSDCARLCNILNALEQNIIKQEMLLFCLQQQKKWLLQKMFI